MENRRARRSYSITDQYLLVTTHNSNNIFQFALATAKGKTVFVELQMFFYQEQPIVAQITCGS